MKILLVMLMLTAVPAVALPVRGAGCAATAETAVKWMLSKTVAADVADGYRVESVRFDAVRGKAWAVVGRCKEPARPRVAIEMDAGVETVVKKPLLVHSGERVTVVSDANETRMQLTGWAEAAGSEGDAMDVRLGSLGGDGRGMKIRCRVLRAGVVEVVR